MGTRDTTQCGRRVSPRAQTVSLEAICCSCRQVAERRSALPRRVPFGPRRHRSSRRAAFRTWSGVGGPVSHWLSRPAFLLLPDSLRKRGGPGHPVTASPPGQRGCRVCTVTALITVAGVSVNTNARAPSLVPRASLFHVPMPVQPQTDAKLCLISSRPSLLQGRSVSPLHLATGSSRLESPEAFSGHSSRCGPRRQLAQEANFACGLVKNGARGTSTFA